MLAYLTAAAVSSLAVTPGGIGTVKLALTTALVAAGLDAPHAVATLVYRLVTLWLATSVGWLLHAGLTSRVIQKVDPPGPAGDLTGRRSIPRSDDLRDAPSYGSKCPAQGR